jgi:hypothetical protein
MLMRLETSPDCGTAVLANVGRTGEFQIRNSAKAFKILSDGLYADKIRAIVRELSTNAYDSHVEAGHPDRPFHVHLPNQLEPFFSVRDEGIGLDEAGVMDLYTTYFQSTKTDSDDFVGALGLGSKSPFSYTDNFTVIATKNGRRGTYTAYLNDAGIPSIVQMLEVETTEPNGVEVKFGVNPNDFRKFHESAKVVYRHFPTEIVNVTGVPDFKIIISDVIRRDIIPGVHFLESRYSSSTSTVVMGMIEYKVELSAIQNHLTENERELFESAMLEIHAPIGAVEMQPSREGLSYTKRTIDYLRQVIHKVSKAVDNEVKSSLDGITNLWDIAEIYNNLQEQNQNKFYRHILRTYVRNKLACYKEIDFSNYNYNGRLYVRIPDKKFEQYNASIKVLVRQTHRASDYAHARADWRDNWELYVDNNTVFVIADCHAALKKTQLNFKKAKHNTTIVIILPKDRKAKFYPERTLKELFGAPRNVAYASSFDVELKPTTPDIHYEQLGLLNMRYSAWKPIGASSEVFKTITDPKKKVLYIPLHGSKIDDPCFMGISESRIEAIAGAIGYNGPIVGVRKKARQLIEKNDNWVLFSKELKKHLNKYTVNDVLPNTNFWAQAVMKVKQVINEVDKNSEFCKLVHEHLDLNARAIPTALYEFLAMTNKEICSIAQGEPPATRFWNAVIQKYPMLHFIKHWESHSDEIVDYIKLVDASSN